MNDVSQLATAMLAITFAATLMVTGQWFTEYRLQRQAIAPAMALARSAP